MNIPSLVKEIDTAILANGNRAVLLQQTQKFSNKKLLTELITSSMNQSLETIVEKSFLHPNGFDKLVLVSGNHFNIRLHNFHPPQVMQPAETVHNHKWEFASSVLSGGYTASTFDVNCGDEERLHYTYTSGVGMELNGSSNITLTQTESLVAGDSYFMPNNRFHSIESVNADGCLTLMMTGLTDETSTNVYSKDLIPSDQMAGQCGLRMFSDQEVVNTLEQILEKI